MIIPGKDGAGSETGLEEGTAIVQPGTEGKKEQAIPVGTNDEVVIDASPIQPLEQETLTGLTTDINLIIKLDCSRNPVLCQ